MSAFKSITSCQHLIKLGNHCTVNTTNFNFRVPTPLTPGSLQARDMFPWRSFVSRHGYVSGCYGSVYDVSTDMQVSFSKIIVTFLDPPAFEVCSAQTSVR